MNQILSVDMSNNKKKSNNKANIKTVIIVFCVLLIIMGILMIGIGIISKNNKNEVRELELSNDTVEEDSIYKPKIEIVQDVSKLNVTIKSNENKISKVVYKWNDGEETQVNGNDESKLEIEIKIPVGENKLSIVATDDKGLEQIFEKEYTGIEQYEPDIALEQDNNNLKIVCVSDKTIKSISYNYDQDEEKIEEINNKEAQIKINILEGQHKLTIKVINEENQEYESTKSVYIPIVKVQTDGENFIIDAEDTRKITKVEINFNGEEQEKEVNNIKYENKLSLKEGENKLILKVYNSDGLSTTKRIKWDK